MKIRLTLETDIKKLFESNKNLMGNPKSGKSATYTNSNGYSQMEHLKPLTYKLCY